MVQADQARDLATPPALHRALGLGASGQAVVNGDAGVVSAPEGPVKLQAEPGSEPPAAAAAVPDAQQSELDWVKRAVEEVSRAFTRLTSRLGTLEARIEILEVERATAPAAPPPAPEPAPEPVPSPDVDRLAARIEQTADRVDVLDGRVRQLDFLPLKVSNVSRAVDQLASAHANPAPPPVTPAEVDDLRRELAAAQQRLTDLDTRASMKTISATVQTEVRRQADRLAAEIPAGPVDLEGLYRELDAVAEFVAARAAATAESLERVGPLEIAVLDIRRELGRAVADFATAQDADDVEPRLQAIESRLQKLEVAGKRIDRLYTALLDIAHANPEARKTVPLS